MKTKTHYSEKFNDPDFITRLRAKDEKAYRELDSELYIIDHTGAGGGYDS